MHDVGGDVGNSRRNAASCTRTTLRLDRCGLRPMVRHLPSGEQRQEQGASERSSRQARGSPRCRTGTEAQEAQEVAALAAEWRRSWHAGEKDPGLGTKWSRRMPTLHGAERVAASCWLVDQRRKTPDPDSVHSEGQFLGAARLTSAFDPAGTAGHAKRSRTFAI